MKASLIKQLEYVAAYGTTHGERAAAANLLQQHRQAAHSNARPTAFHKKAAQVAAKEEVVRVRAARPKPDVEAAKYAWQTESDIRWEQYNQPAINQPAGPRPNRPPQKPPEWTEHSPLFWALAAIVALYLIFS